MTEFPSRHTPVDADFERSTQSWLGSIESPSALRAIVSEFEGEPASVRKDYALERARERLQVVSESANPPAEEATLERIFSGELPDPVQFLDGEQLGAIWQSQRCPRDGRTMTLRPNPRHPDLGQELYCSCGFAFTE